MSMHDFHTRLEASDGDPLFAALSDLRSTRALPATLQVLSWPDWVAPETTRGD